MQHNPVTQAGDGLSTISGKQIMTRLSRRLALGALLLFGFGSAHAQCVSLTAVNIASTQNFDTLALSGTSSTLPTGWSIAEAGTNANTTYTAGTGSGNSGDTYSFGAAASSERALGGLLSGSLTPTFGACFTNNTGGAINSVDIAYTGEQWRLGTAARTDQIDFQYSLNATNLTSGSWSDDNTLDFTTPTTVTTGAKDGNAAANRTAISSTVALTSPVANGATIWIRWTDFNASGADDGLSIDDFSLTARAGGGGTPPPELTIAEIQGAGLESTHVDEIVTTRGVVTALKFNNGFFLQSTGEDVDADPATSEAIFVFTSSAPTVAVGDAVSVTATVKEFTSGSNLNQLAITELVSPTINVLSAGNALPAAVELTGADVNAGNNPGTLERLEGMRVSVAQAWVVEGSEGNISEANATSTTTGVFQVVMPDIARPFREPGIGVLDVIPIPPGKNPPRFDTNQERLMVRSRGQVGATALAVDTETLVTDMVGVLDYFAGTWALTPDPGNVIGLSSGKVATAVSEPGYADVTIGGFNLLRFFDDVNDPGVGDVVLTAVALDKRLTKTSAAICDYLKTPDILGVVEVENLNVLALLAERINTTCARAPAYTAYLEQGNDVGGINVGFLVSTRDIGEGVARVDALQVTQFGKDATIPNPDASTAILNDRPPLMLRAVVHQQNGASYPVTVIVNHLRSLSGVDDTSPGSSGWATTGDRVRAKRAAQAAYLAGLVEQFQQDDPAEKIVLVGDFNAFEFNDGYVDVMGVIRGDEAAEDQVLTYVDSPITTPLIDGSALIADATERYSYVFAGSAQTLDHVVVNEALVMGAANAAIEHARINADFGVHHFGDVGNALRVSDHDPVRLSIQVADFLSADLSVAASAEAVQVAVGDAAVFHVDVANAGPSVAAPASLVIALNALVSPTVSAPMGWTCDAPVQDAMTQATVVSCSTPAFAVDGNASFMVQVPITAEAILILTATVDSAVSDPVTGNNSATAQVLAGQAADLSLSFSAPQPGGRGRSYADTLTLRNDGPDAAVGAKVHLLLLPTYFTVLSVATPNGWSCRNGAAKHSYDCSALGLVPAGAEVVFVVKQRDPRSHATSNPYRLEAQVEATTQDPVPGNNEAIQIGM